MRINTAICAIVFLLVGGESCKDSESPIIIEDSGALKDVGDSGGRHLDLSVDVDSALPNDVAKSPTCAVHASGELTQMDHVIPAWTNRAYDLFVPDTYDCDRPVGLILALHGGGANKEHQRAISCPSLTSTPPSDSEAEGCLNFHAKAAGMAVLYANGTGGLAPNVRTFNAANDGMSPLNDLNCTSGRACRTNQNELKYFKDLMVEVRKTLNVGKLFVTGFSNGASMAHRLGCELPGVTGIAPVAGGNQFVAVTGTCTPDQAVSVLQIHGSEDSAWLYLGGESGVDPGDKVGIPAHVSVAIEPSTISSWIATNGCDPAATVSDVPGGTLHEYVGCNNGAAVSLRTVEGAGHTWPDGWAYSDRAGSVNRDFSAAKAVVDFFAAQ